MSPLTLDQEYLPSQSYATQDHLNYISNWTDEHMMQLNPTKCNYMIFTRAQTDFATSTIDKLAVSKILGVLIDESLSWERNTK